MGGLSLRGPAALLAIFVLAAGPTHATPDYSDSIDFVYELDLGHSAYGGNVVAPFNVTGDVTGAVELRYIEVNSTNLVPVTIRVYDSRSFNAGSWDGPELFAAESVTYMLWDVRNISVETTPASNHTSLDEMRSNFSKTGLDPSHMAYFVVVENRKVESATILYRQDRELKDILDGPLGTAVLVAAVALPIGLIALVLFLRRGRKTKQNGGGAPPPPGGTT